MCLLRRGDREGGGSKEVRWIYKCRSMATIFAGMNRVHWVVYYWYLLLQVLPRHLNSRLRELKIWEMKLWLAKYFYVAILLWQDKTRVMNAIRGSSKVFCRNLSRHIWRFGNPGLIAQEELWRQEWQGESTESPRGRARGRIKSSRSAREKTKSIMLSQAKQSCREMSWWMIRGPKSTRLETPSYSQWWHDIRSSPNGSCDL